MTMRRFYTTVDNAQIHVRHVPAGDAGAAPLLCLHPAPSSGLYFETVAPLLSANRDVYAPDYPGYGGSDSLPAAPMIDDYAAAMSGVIEQSGDTRFDILGFHTGCLVGAEIARRAPSRVRRLVLCDVPYFDATTRESMKQKMATPMQVTPELSSLAAPWAFNVESRVPGVPLPRALSLFAEHLRAGETAHLAFAAAFEYDCEARFAELDADVAVLATQSPLYDASASAAKAIKGAKFVDVPEVTTAVFESGADAISKRILAALDN